MAHGTYNTEVGPVSIDELNREFYDVFKGSLGICYNSLPIATAGAY